MTTVPDHPTRKALSNFDYPLYKILNLARSLQRADMSSGHGNRTDARRFRHVVPFAAQRQRRSRQLLRHFEAVTGNGSWASLGITLGKAVIFALLVVFVGMRVIPWLLHFIARTRSRELFILAILAIALGIALGSAELFGVSLALGAFAAGAVVSESPLSHQVAADLLPFRDSFAALFFVSIGMLVNPLYLWQNIGQILTLTLLIVVGKFVLTLLLGVLFLARHAPRWCLAPA